MKTLKKLLLFSLAFVLSLGLLAEGADKIHKLTALDAETVLVDLTESQLIEEDPGEIRAADPVSNFPDPFINKTTISYTLPDYGYVVVKVLFQGRTFDLVHGEYQDKGPQSVGFWAGNLPGGVYTCVIFYNDEMWIERMTKVTPIVKKKYVED